MDAFFLLMLVSFLFLFFIIGQMQAFSYTNIAIAETINDANKSSQNINLLEANISSIDILDDKDSEAKDDKSDKDDQNIDIDTIEEDASVIVSENALIPVSSYSPEFDNDNSYEDEIIIYSIREKDSLGEIAKMFDVSVNTILWANDLKRGQKLIPGETLLILPTSGVEHTITKGQNLKAIADFYKADILDIARFNGITEKTELAIGDKIMIPNGEISSDDPAVSKKMAANSSSFNKQAKSSYIKGLVDYFINPVPRARKSQGLHGPGRRGIDLAAPTGTKVLASANATVLFAKKGWNGAYGNLIILKHPNGTKSLYAHLSKIKTHAGATVEQGETIGYVGSTGRSTGPHLHFEVFNAKNPGSDWSWKKR